MAPSIFWQLPALSVPNASLTYNGDIILTFKLFRYTVKAYVAHIESNLREILYSKMNPYFVHKKSFEE